jgi:hypothetical protein
MRNITKLAIGAVLTCGAAVAATAPAAAQQIYPYGTYLCGNGMISGVYSYPNCIEPLYSSPDYYPAPVYPAPVYAPPVVEPYFGIGIGFGGHRDFDRGHFERGHGERGDFHGGRGEHHR